jgi:leucyl/phenylalanyl-tRNA---protein transferase
VGNEVTANHVLAAYQMGLFPMADNANDESFHWVEPSLRGIIPLDTFHLPARLARTIRSSPLEIHINKNFSQVIEACATSTSTRTNTWINGQIRKLYEELFEHGFCHTVEVYRENKLVGGLYGLSMGSAFFGESMFSLERDTSKIALAHLVARLKQTGFVLLDTQFINDHLKQFGAIEIPQKNYLKLLQEALKKQAYFDDVETYPLLPASEVSNTLKNELPV